MSVLLKGITCLISSKVNSAEYVMFEIGRKGFANKI